MPPWLLAVAAAVVGRWWRMKSSSWLVFTLLCCCPLSISARARASEWRGIGRSEVVGWRHLRIYLPDRTVLGILCRWLALRWNANLEIASDLSLSPMAVAKWCDHTNARSTSPPIAKHPKQQQLITTVLQQQVGSNHVGAANNSFEHHRLKTREREREREISSKKLFITHTHKCHQYPIQLSLSKTLWWVPPTK